MKNTLKWSIHVNVPIRRLVTSGKSEVSPVSRDDLVAAQAVLLRRAQYDVYCEEITALSCGKQVKSSSHILALDPVLDGELLRGWRSFVSFITAERRQA